MSYLKENRFYKLISNKGVWKCNPVFSITLAIKMLKYTRDSRIDNYSRPFYN